MTNSNIKWVIKTKMAWQDGETTYETVDLSDELVKALHEHVADILIARHNLSDEYRGYVYCRMDRFEIFRTSTAPSPNEDGKFDIYKPQDGEFEI